MFSGWCCIRYKYLGFQWHLLYYQSAIFKFRECDHDSSTAASVCSQEVCSISSRVIFYPLNQSICIGTSAIWAIRCRERRLIWKWWEREKQQYFLTDTYIKSSKAHIRLRNRITRSRHHSKFIPESLLFKKSFSRCDIPSIQNRWFTHKKRVEKRTCNQRCRRE